MLSVVSISTQTRWQKIQTIVDFFPFKIGKDYFDFFPIKKKAHISTKATIQF